MASATDESDAPVDLRGSRSRNNFSPAHARASRRGVSAEVMRLSRSLGPLARCAQHAIVRNAHPALARPAALAVSATFAAATLNVADCHCQVPCGIFDDPVRVTLMKEHAATCRKAMAQIKLLSSSGHVDAQSLNQVSRWVTVKEESAQGCFC